jgi:hypothetical protein
MEWMDGEETRAPSGFGRGRVRRALLSVAVIVASTVTGTLAANQARAQISTSRTGPIVYLSDGEVINLAVAVTGNPGEVKAIVYTVHAPAGVQMTNVQYTGGELSKKQSVQYFADDTANTYDSDTVVYSVQNGMAVTATTKVSNAGTGSASGYSNQNLPIHIAGCGCNN